jgi:hypothetical protein
LKPLRAVGLLVLGRGILVGPHHSKPGYQRDGPYCHFAIEEQNSNLGN